MKEEILIVILIVFLILLMALMPPFSQFKSEVNNGAFRPIKIKKFTFMFRAPNGISVSKEGIALPLFVLQIVGYLIALLSIIINILLLIVLNKSLIVMAISTIAIFAAEAIFIIAFTTIIGKISKKR